MIKTSIEISSNELEYDTSKSDMALVRKTKDQRQSHGLLVFVEPSRCADSSSPLCEAFSHIVVPAEDSFRYYQFNVHAIDYAGNIGISTAYVVVIPQKFKDNLESPSYFVDFVGGAPDARNVIETREMIWDISRDDQVGSEFVSTTVARTLSGELAMSGINVPDNEEELQELIEFLQEQLQAGLARRRRLLQARELSGECICTSEVRITSISSAQRQRRNQMLGWRKLQGGAVIAVIAYEIVLTCDGACVEDETEEEDTSDSDTTDTANDSSSAELSDFISSGGFAEDVKKAAEETGMDSLTSVVVESVVVSNEIQTTTEAKAGTER